jgi:hypothetical protein
MAKSILAHTERIFQELIKRISHKSGHEPVLPEVYLY